MVQYYCGSSWRLMRCSSAGVFKERGKSESLLLFSGGWHYCPSPLLTGWRLRWQGVCLQCRRPGFIPGWGRSPGGGNGTPLECSCLGNPVDRGAWRAAGRGSRSGTGGAPTFAFRRRRDAGSGLLAGLLLAAFESSALHG